MKIGTSKYLLFYDCYGKPLPDEKLNIMMQNALDEENYELCQLIKEEQDKRKRTLIYKFGYIK